MIGFIIIYFALKKYKMDDLCKFIYDNINLNYDISYYIEHSNGDVISYDPNDINDTIDYITSSLHYYFNKHIYDIFINLDNKLIVSFITNNRKCDIMKVKINHKKYWILYIHLI
jgi:hypothetical protein